MAYRTEIQVRFGDVNKAGIVYYPVIFHYLHIAQEDFFADYVGVPYHRLIEEERLGFPTVHDSTDFHKPLRYGDTLEISHSYFERGRQLRDVRVPRSQEGLGPVASKLVGSEGRNQYGYLGKDCDP